MNKKMKKKRIILVSGGIDSYASYLKYKEEAKWENVPVFVNYNGAYTEKERKVCCGLYGKELKIVNNVLNLQDFETGVDSYIPGRNLMLILTALLIVPEASEIVLSGVKDDNALDKTKEALEDMSCTVSTIMGKSIAISSPWIDMTKAEVVSWLLNHTDKETICSTCSCYHPSEECWCGGCKACFRRFCAFFANDLIDPKIPFFKNQEIMDMYTSELTKYDIERQKQIKNAVNYSKKELQKIDDALSENFHVMPRYVKTEYRFEEKLRKGQCFKNIFVDIDGTLTNETAGFNPVTYSKRTLNEEMKRKVKQNYIAGNKITLFTARHAEDLFFTIKWLEHHEIPYHEIIFHKPHYFVLIDDKTANPVNPKVVCDE